MSDNLFIIIIITIIIIIIAISLCIVPPLPLPPLNLVIPLPVLDFDLSGEKWLEITIHIYFCFLLQEFVELSTDLSVRKTRKLEMAARDIFQLRPMRDCWYIPV